MKKILFLLIGILYFPSLFAIENNLEDYNITANSTIEDIRDVLKRLNIPVFEFDFIDQEFPKFDIIEHPEGCIGRSITNNEYVEGSLIIYKGNETLYESGEYLNKESGVRVKCRGNGSTAQEYIKKKSYKVKLSKKADLLFRDDKAYKDKDWLLLGNGSFKMNSTIGAEIGRLCGIPWEPVGVHVCVIMNDQYMGSYYLVEAVKNAEKRVNIDESGYILENDAYWWKPDEVYFKSEYLPYYMGWTFKEPDTDEFEDDTLDNIQKVISVFEDVLYNGEDISKMIDYESFANWLIAHDILGTVDAMGSNMFIVKEDYNPENIFSSPLKMGPIWDFDDCFKSESDQHAGIFYSDGFWYPALLKYPEFRKVIKERWEEIKPNVIDSIHDYILTYMAENPDLGIIREIDRVRNLMGYSPTTLPEDDFEEYMTWFVNRIYDLDILLADIEENEEPTTGTEFIVKDKEFDKIVESYNLLGEKVNNNYKGIIINVYKDGRREKIINK